MKMYFHALLVCACMIATPIYADDSRASRHAEKQAAKTKTVTVHKPSFAERIVVAAEERFLNPPRLGLFAGSVFPGGGLAFGPAIRVPYAGNGAVTAYGSVSVRRFTGAGARLASPTFGGGRFNLDLHGSFIDAPRVDVHAIGNDSSADRAAVASYRPLTVGGAIVFHPTRWFAMGGGADYLDVTTGNGRRGRAPGDVFTPSELPGLAASPSFAVFRAFGGIDTRDSPGYSRRGGLLRGEIAQYEQRSGDFDFRRLDIEAQRLIPILRENWVIALRGVVSMTYADSVASIPYFLMPDLGGGHNLRGFDDFRFRDANRMILTGEYRWTPSRFLDMALFYEAGKVARDRSDLDLQDLHRSYGIGARFHTPGATVLRIEVARSGEATRLVFAGGPAF